MLLHVYFISITNQDKTDSLCFISCLLFHTPVMFSPYIYGMFGSQPHFAKSKFGNLACVWFLPHFEVATLYPYGPPVIDWIFLPHLPNLGLAKCGWEPNSPLVLFSSFIYVLVLITTQYKRKVRGRKCRRYATWFSCSPWGTVEALPVGKTAVVICLGKLAGLSGIFVITLFCCKLEE
jgi:hypothetical protein